MVFMNEVFSDTLADSPQPRKKFISKKERTINMIKERFNLTHGKGLRKKKRKNKKRGNK